METVVILITLSLIYLANILIIGLGIKTIINTYWTYYMPINHESHIELDGIVISVKYPGSGPHSTEYVEVEFEYEGQKYKRKTKYNFAKYYKKGDTVKVMLSDGTEENGTVASVTGTTATVTISDDGPTVGDEVTVTTADGTKVGTGTLYVHQPLAVTETDGTVGTVYVSENEEVDAGDSLFTLTDITDSADKDKLLAERENLTDELNTLLKLKETGEITATCDGTVDEVNVSDGTEVTASASGSSSSSGSTSTTGTTASKTSYSSTSGSTSATATKTSSSSGSTASRTTSSSISSLKASTLASSAGSGLKG